MYSSLLVSLNKLRDISNSLVSEENTFCDVYDKCKSKLPMNKFMGTANNVRRHLKKIRTLNILGTLESKLSSTTKIIDSAVLNSILEDCMMWLKLVVSTSDACLKAFGHCEQNLKIGHFLIFYVSFLAVLARLHTLSKAMYLLIARLAVDIKRELTKNLPYEQRNVIIENFKKELLSSAEISEEYASLLTANQENLDIILQANEEDLGEIVSRNVIKNEESSNTPKNILENEFKGAVSVRNLRQIFKKESFNLSERCRAEVEKILQETQHTCTALLEAKRLTIQQSGQLIASLMTKTDEDSTDLQYFNMDFGEKEKLVNPILKEHDVVLPRLKKILKSMPSAKELKKLCRDSLPNISEPKKRKLITIIKRSKTELLSLREAGKMKDYKRHMALLTKKIRNIANPVSKNPHVTLQVPSFLNKSDIQQTLLSSSENEENELESTDMLEKKRALGKALKTTKTLDGLLQTWNDLLCNKREDLNCLLPSKVKRSKLVCVKKNLLQLKKSSKKQNIKSAIKKITSFIFDLKK